MIRVLIGSFLISFILGTGFTIVWAAETVQRTFVVHCYDVGIEALKDKPGIVQVKRTWRDLEETNIVIYDPEKVDVKQLEDWLKQAGTHIRTLATD